MKKYAVLAMAAIAFLTTPESSEAQVLQRFRNNIREAIIPQILPLRPIQNFNSAPPQARIQPGISNRPSFSPPQVRTQRPAPQRITSGPQQLTPYSRLAPQQRVAVPQQRIVAPQQRVAVPQQRIVAPQPQRVIVPQQRVVVAQPQFSNVPRLNVPVPTVNPAIRSNGETKIRIVTYLDPSSGRTYQRRYLIPGSSPTGINQGANGQVTIGRTSIVNQPTIIRNSVAVNSPVVSIPRPTPPAVQSLVPPIQFSTRSTPQPVNVSSGLLPALSGPVLSAPRSSVEPIAASIDNASISSQVETVSAEVETVTSTPDTSSAGIPDLSGITIDTPEITIDTPVDSAGFESAPGMPETTSTGIPDLSGISVAPASLDPEEEASQDLFFDDDSAGESVVAPTDEIAEGEDYSVFEEAEEE